MNSSELRGYLTGLILGDGCIDKGVQKRAFEIKSVNSDFIYKIQEDLKLCSPFEIKVTTKPSYCKDGLNHKEVNILRIRSHPYFAKKYHYFYDDRGRKRITNESLHWLNFNGIANWYMSDGYICLVGKTKGDIKDRRIDLCTDRYQLEDIKKIQNFFLVAYKWETSIIPRKNRGKTTYRLRFKLSSAQDMLYKISKYVVDSFKYKLDMKYNYQPKWMNEEYYHLMLEIQKRESPTK